MTTALARKDENRPILYTHYIKDAEYMPDPDLDLDGEPGVRPLRFLYNPTFYFTPRRDDKTPFEPQRPNFARWMPAFIEAYRDMGMLYLAARRAGVAANTVLRFRHCSPDFDAWLNELHERDVDDVESSLVRQAKSDKNTLATLAYLNAHRAELYKRPGEVRHEVAGSIDVKHSHTIHIMIPDNGRGDRLIESDDLGAIEGEFTEVPGLGDGSE